MEPDGGAETQHLIESPPQRHGISPELEGALGRLRERERELIALRFGAELTGPEIATLTGLSLPNVQQILSRSLRRVRTELGVGRERADAATGPKAAAEPGLGTERADARD